jgi:hypothetical protein
MVRKKSDGGDIEGHYPTWAIKQLVEIEILKDKGYSNEEIAKKIQNKNKLQPIIALITSKETRIQIISYVSLLLVVVVLANEMGLISIGKSKTKNIEAIMETSNITPDQIITSGTSFVPKEQNRVFVKTSSIANTSRINVTFKSNYTPATRYWVSTVKDMEGFVIELDSPVAQDSEFDWWASK